MDRHEGIKSVQDQKTEHRPVTADSEKQKQRPRESTPEMAALAGAFMVKGESGSDLIRLDRFPPLTGEPDEFPGAGA